MENELSKSEIEEIKKELIVRRDKIMSDLSGISESDEHESDNLGAKFPEYGDKPDENAQEIDEYTRNLATEKVLEDNLRDINGALTRIEDGTYGVCKYCKKDIPVKRLLARPVASACIECKTKLQNSR